MEEKEMMSAAKAMRASRRLGQNFLMNRNLAKREASYAASKNVVEMGPGLGMLTSELCMVAKSVTAIEKDDRLYALLRSNNDCKNLNLVNADFFSLEKSFFSGIDIMVSNIPYNLSSSVLYWLAGMGIPAVLSMQEEFVSHMSAVPGTRKYSKLSVVTSLSFDVEVIANVPPTYFYPRPKVRSSVILLTPKNRVIGEKELAMISCLMEHKKKKLRNALIDSAGSLCMPKSAVSAIAEKLPMKDTRPFQLTPEGLLAVSEEVLVLLGKSA